MAETIMTEISQIKKLKKMDLRIIDLVITLDSFLYLGDVEGSA